MKANWDLNQLVGFLDSWSATQRYKVEIIWYELVAAWGDEEEPHLIRWSLHFRIGRNN